MKLHGNARTWFRSRLVAVERVEEYRLEGELGLTDRSSAPGSMPHRTPEDRVQVIACLRRSSDTSWLDRV